VNDTGISSTDRITTTAALTVPPRAGVPDPVVPAPAAVASRPSSAAVTRALPLSAAELYRRAEDAMQRHDRPDVRQQLERVVATFPDDRLADQARFELAQLALADGDHEAAARQLDVLAAGAREPALRESSAFLRCRLALEDGHVDRGLACLDGFRAAYRRSADDAEALALMIAHASRKGDCAAVDRLANEYARLHAGGPFGSEAARRRERCRAASR